MQKADDYEYVPHNFVKRKFMAWSACQSCGLVSLNNLFTEWSVKKGCDNRYHPSYKSARNKYTELGI